MQHWKLRLNVLAACFVQGILSKDISLTTSKTAAVIDEDFTFTCTFNGYDHVDSSRWETVGTNSPGITRSVNGSCTGFGSFNDTSLYKIECPSAKSFAVTILRVKLSDHNKTWKCFDRVRMSNTVQIYVKVPVKYVDMYAPTGNYMKEHHRQSVRCKTSACRPQPNVNWYLENPNDLVKYSIAGNLTQTNTSAVNGLVAVENWLDFYPNRSVNSWMLYCEAWTDNTNLAVQSRQIVLNISYPPDSPPRILGYERNKIYVLIESEQGELSCSVTGGNPLPTLNWNCYNSKTPTMTTVNNTVITNVTWEAARNQQSCSCELFHIFDVKQATNVMIDVMYPPTKPLFTISSNDVTDVVQIIESKKLQVVCESRSNPTPNYTWNGPHISDKIEQTLTIPSIYRRNEGKYDCTAKNTMVRSDETYKRGRNTSSINVKVLYPPGQLKVTFGKSDGQFIKQNSINVIKGDTFSLYCDAIGYPNPEIVWENLSRGRVLNITTIPADVNITCKATNKMIETVGENRTGSATSSLSITVLYPPISPKISVSIDSSDKVTAAERINIIEKETIDLECYSESKPKPSYMWIVNTTHTRQEQILKLKHIHRNETGNYTCYVQNLMNRTFGEDVARNNSSSTLLNILYPADVGALGETSLRIASKLNITCPVIPGNPSVTEIFWTRKCDNRLWNSSQLVILNVTRADDTVYTCTVLNGLIPSVGDATKINRSSEFHLNVFFPAQITVFSEFENESKEAIVVNETEGVSLICTAEANPASNMTIRSPQNREIAVMSNTNILLHTLQNTSYVDAGEYICSGRNNYSDDQESRSKLILIVRCPPKLSSDNTKDGRIATTLHTDVTLQFTALDYLDEPNKTMFIWFKENATIENDDSKFIMSSNGLQSALSITNITQTDLGKYGVRVSNSVGQYIHLYKLVAKDKPEMPKNFIYINGSVTDSSVTLKWTPGFYGGYPQTFILLYKTTTEQQWQNKSIEDTGDKEMNYTLFGLLSTTEYQVKAFARNKEGDSAYTENLQFITKALVTVPAQPHSSNTIGIVAGSVSSSVIIITTAGIIVLVLMYRKRNSKENGSVYQNVQFSVRSTSSTLEPDINPITSIPSNGGNHNTTRRKRESLHMEETLFEGLQEVDDVPFITKERTEYCNSPDIIEKIDRIKVNELFSYVSGRSEESFEADYQKLPTELQKPCTFARKPENIALNRYNGIYPYDHSRVKLHGQPDFFINACYIDGYKSSNAYIASLGPTAKTTNDFETFWKMIWYERADVIVMLTNLRETSGMKCEKYWPEGGASIWYGEVCVSSQKTENFAEYTVRQFSVYKEEERRSLTHLHYTAWPDKTVPEDVTSLIEFRQRIKTTPTSSDGPIVVHCSAGIGRTGTLIALDRLIEEGQDKGSLNVFECVDSMREQRVKMVQTFEQYMYIYKALVNALTFDCETIPVETFNEYVDATNNNMYSLMFQQLRQSVETDSKADVEARLKNEKLTNKNRRGADIPGSRFRALLYLNRSDEGSEYINAVYINSFVKKDYFIVAQSPLPCTVADFITMVYQEDCSCIVTMEDLKDPGMTVGQYLPDDKKTLTVGSFKVSSSRLETKHNYVVRKMKIKYSGKIDSGEKTIYHFQYTKWMTGHDTPVDAREFVQFVNEVKEYANELGEERSHVIVHCLKANERSGLFCALAILMEKIKLERQVNVLNTLRHLQTRRRTAITSMEQVKFCYQATSAYIQMNMLG